MRPALLLSLLLAFSACDSGDQTDTCGTNGGSVTASVDGLPFTARCLVAARTDDGFGFVANDRSDASAAFLPYRELSFDLPTTTGTYRLGGQASALAYFSLVPPTGAPSRFAADSGAVVIESVEGRRYKGRFSFRTGATHTVGQGFFDVTLQGN